MNNVKHKSPEKEPVVAVCGAEARVYGPVAENGRRPLIKVLEFAHRGAAILYAQEFEERHS